jgi:hypothetical protein
LTAPARPAARALPAAILLATFSGCLHSGLPGEPALAPEPLPRLGALDAGHRRGYLQRAQVWRDVPTASLDLMTGPRGRGAFAVDQEITCDYVEQAKLNGLTPKFMCRAPEETLRIKYGEKNGEVYAEVVSSRLFWALGFGTDAVYPVRVVCHGCPIDPWLWKTAMRVPEQRFDVASVERKFEGVTIADGRRPGWSWRELDDVDPARGGAPAAHRDALKLLAVLVQHGDNKPDQQRIVCLPEGVRRTDDGEICDAPFLVVSDLGSTFGGAGNLSRDQVAKMRFAHWGKKPVFRDKTGCVGDLDASMWGDLQYPVIREAGRRFLADRLALLSDRQIHDMFAAARVDRRKETLEDGGAKRPVTADDWARAFKEKRRQIEERRCPE